MDNKILDEQRFREGWTIMNGHVAEYKKVKYFMSGPYWIGAGIRWCENLSGQIMPSLFSHAMGGTHPVKHWRFWYFHITVCKVKS